MAETFTCRLEWTGGAGAPLAGADFSRDLLASFANAPAVPLSAAASYKGDGSRLNPEALFVTAISSCQALTYLYLAARAGVPVVKYVDEAEGKLGIVDGKMQMASITLSPTITLAAGSDESKAESLIEKAHAGCFIANSIKTPVTITAHFHTLE